MIEYEHVIVEFDGKKIIDDFSLRIAENEHTVLWGPSGSGKSTLMSVLLGFVKPAGGTVKVDGEIINDTNIVSVRSKMAWVPQEAALPFDYVKEMIAAAFDFKANRDKKPTIDKILNCFSQLGLNESIYEKRVSEVSGGENQRIVLIIAALLNKKILLLDEPTSALDPDSIKKLVSFLQDMEDTTIMAISHDERFISSFGKQVKIG